MANLAPESGRQSRARMGLTHKLIGGQDGFRHSTGPARALLCKIWPVLAIIILSGCLPLSHASIAFGGMVALREPQIQTPSSTGNDGRFNEINRLIDSGDLARARKMLAEETALRCDTYQTLFLEAKILFREQRYRESMKILERSLSLNQRDAEVFKLVASNAILLNRTDIAEQALKTAAQLSPNDYLVFFHLGALSYPDSRFPPAQPVLEKSVNLNPEYIPARLFLGLTLEELSQERSAVDCYLQAIQLAERSGFKGEQPYLFLGRLLYRQSKLDESLPYLQKAAQANSQSCEVWCLLARIHSARGRETEAVTALDQCTEADPKYSEAHYLLSRVYVKQGRTEDAAKELAQFQELKKLEKNIKDPRKNQRVTP